MAISKPPAAMKPTPSRTTVDASRGPVAGKPPTRASAVLVGGRGAFDGGVGVGSVGPADRVVMVDATGVVGAGAVRSTTKDEVAPTDRTGTRSGVYEIEYAATFQRPTASADADAVKVMDAVWPGTPPGHRQNAAS